MTSKRFIYLMQIVIIISMVVIQLMLQWIVMRWWEGPLTISIWALGIAVAYWMYKKNVVINSILIASFLLIVFMVGTNIARGNFFDAQHLFTLVTVVYFIYSRTKFKMSYVFISTGVFMAWAWSVWATGIAYQYFSFEMMVAIVFVMGVNIIVAYGLAQYRGHLYNEFDHNALSDTLKEIRLELAKIKVVE